MEKLRSRYQNKTGLLEQTIASYDLHAKDFYKKHGDYEPFDGLLELQRYIQPGSRILDAGCGLGRDTDYLIRQGYPDSIGLDMSYGMLTFGQKSVKFKFPAVHGDFRHLPFTSGSFDAVWAVASIIHIPPREVVDVLMEFKRVIRGGYIYLSVLRGRGEEAESGDEGSIKRGWRYFVYYEFDDIKLLLDQAGLEVVFSWDRPGKPVDPASPKAKKRDWLHIITQPKNDLK